MSFTSNPFAALDDSEPAAAAPAPKAAAPAPAAAAPKAAAKPAARGPKKVQGDREVNADTPLPEGARDDRKAGRGGARGGRGARGGGRGGANPRSNGGTFLGGDRPRRENGGGRPFDRQSQTGHKDSEKSEAQGWGAEEGKKELEAEVQGEADAKVDGTATPKGDETPARRAPREEEEEDNTLTYEQHLAALAAKKLNIALPEARVANEGADDSKWAAHAVTKKGEQTTEEWLASAAKEKANKTKKQPTKTYLEVDFASKPPRRDGPVRETREGGRGGRGGRGRGAPRGGAAAGAPRGATRAPKAAAPALGDSAAFPSLA